ncbi:MAG: peptide ABC transporter substrate-binding protein, partial [Anaerolineae bacterium]|nr:peptide ABC transporter substrate-binding protein [Anaerolineae bacterium]
TLEVELDRPTGHFPQLLAHSVFYPVPRHVVNAHDESWTEVETMVTNGPFKLAARQQSGSLALERNPLYHGRFAGNLERLELSLLEGELGQQLQLYEDNSLDVLTLNGLPLPEMDRARHRHAGEYVPVPALFTTYVGFDVSLAPFADPRVRRAFALATDRETLAHVTMRGYEFPATGGLVPPGMPGHSPGIGLPYDLERARHLLAEAGYSGGVGFPEVACMARAHEPYTQYLAALWRENLGVDIRLEPWDSAQHPGRPGKKPRQMWITGWVADYPDPDNFLRASEWRLGTKWQNEAYDQLLEGARSLTDQAERVRMYQQADLMLVREAVVLPLFHARWHLLVKPWVRRYPTSPLRQSFWKDVIIEPH